MFEVKKIIRILFLSFIFLYFNQTNAGRLQIGSIEANNLSQQERQHFLQPFLSFLQTEIFVNEIISNLIQSFKSNIEIELIFDKALQIIPKYKNDSLQGGAIIPEMKKMVILAHPSEFKKSLTETRKQAIIQYFVFELFNLKRALQSQEDGSLLPHPLDFSTASDFCHAIKTEEFKTFENPQLVAAYTIGTQKHGWDKKNVTKYTLLRSKERFMNHDAHNITYQKQFDSIIKLVQQSKNIFDSFNTKVKVVMDSDRCTADKIKEIKMLYTSSKNIMQTSYSKSKIDKRVYEEKIKPLWDDFEKTVQTKLWVLKHRPYSIINDLITALSF